MNKPKIDRQTAYAKLPPEICSDDKLLELLAKQNYVFIIAFRGYYQDTMGAPGKNDRGIYDDCMCVVSDRVFMTFNGNTDPSRFRPGIATLVPGVYPYRRAKHGITTHADGGYWAFRPATKNESLPVWRDGDVRLNGKGERMTSEGIAINIHKGGYNTTSSEGCQTIYPDQWDNFRDTVYDLMAQCSQEKILYVLADWEQ
jgi:hypothetical protein